MKENNFTADLADLATFKVFNHFQNFTTAQDGFTSLAADIGTTVAVGDGRAGIAVLTTGAVANNEALLRTTNEVFLMATRAPLYARCRLQYTEATTNDAAVYFGFMDAMGANLLVDTTGLPKATFTGAGIYKRMETTVWRTVTSNGVYATVGVDNASGLTSGGSAYQVLEIIGEEGLSAVDVTFTFKVNGEYIQDPTTRQTLRHTVLLASTTEMHLGVYVKAGAGGASEVVNVDYIYGAQRGLVSATGLW